MPRKGQRLVVLFLLLWLFADLGVQGSCCLTNEPLPMPEDGFSLSVPANTEQSQRTGVEDSCFCCCTHILPSAHFELATSLAIVLEVPLAVFEKPRGFHTPVYHPPRS